MPERAYLDYNASAPLIDAARTAMVAALDVSANPSSVHAEGRKARQLIETARRQVAALAGGQSQHVVFTSGATEAASTLLTPHWRMGRSPLTFSKLYVSATDHPCVRTGGRFSPEDVVEIGVGANGVIDLAALGAALDAHDKRQGLPLVAIHLVNNETGVIQPAAEIAALAHKAGGVLVLDAVQAAGRIPLDVDGGLADFVILTSHKIGGPKGVGAIVARGDLMMPAALITGGGQEKGYRAGTENVAAIAGFGAGAEQALEALAGIENLRALRDRVESLVRALAPGVRIYGADAPRVANTTFFELPGVKAETAQIAFDLAGVALSAGSACSSGKVGASKVLTAMGFAESGGALRVSVGPGTREADIALFEKALAALLARTQGTQAA